MAKTLIILWLLGFIWAFAQRVRRDGWPWEDR